MTPYSFGYRLAAHLEKRADVPMQWGEPAPPTMAQGFGELAFGRDGAGWISGQQDPWKRGIVQDLALYSNPFTGLPTGINDVTRHLYNGRYINALGSAGMTGLSFLPGVGGMIGKGVGKGINAMTNVGTRMAGNAAAGGFKQMAGRTLAATGRYADDFARAGGQISNNINQGLSKQMQRVVTPVADPARKTYSNYFTTRAWNEGIKNPYSIGLAADQAGGLFLAPPGTSNMPSPTSGNTMMPPMPMRPMPMRPMPMRPMQFQPMPMVR